jgi:hypothetical protein
MWFARFSSEESSSPGGFWDFGIGFTVGRFREFVRGRFRGVIGDGGRGSRRDETRRGRGEELFWNLGGVSHVTSGAAPIASPIDLISSDVCETPIPSHRRLPSFTGFLVGNIWWR